jgi:hypothetical protein
MAAKLNAVPGGTLVVKVETALTALPEAAW